MRQMSFGDAEYAGKRKQTRRELFLAEMEQAALANRLARTIWAVLARGKPYNPAAFSAA